MSEIKERIPLQIVGGRVVLTAVIECSSLRIQKQIMNFVIDTGSQNSHFSYKDVMALQIPVNGRGSTKHVDFGGSRYKMIDLPPLTVHILKENKDIVSFKISVSALKTGKINEAKIKVAEMLPSILGLDFLKNSKLSLHVIPSENLAYLQIE